MALFFIALFIFFLLEIAYFQIADRYNIIDKPNQRSSHTSITLRGGGIIFRIALIAGVLIFQPSLWYLALGVFCIAGISFLDDILTLNNKIRIGVHMLSVGLVIYQLIQNSILSLSSLPDYDALFFILCSLFLIIAMVFFIGIINAYNFMDGINGITVLYSLVTLGSILYAQQEVLQVSVLDANIYRLLMAALAVFAFFNVRKRAKTFAGDVGSISMALILCFLIASLVLNTANFKWILLLGVYGLDAVATITCRIFRKENIFDAHRSHFYQYLANGRKWPHTAVSLLYAAAQLLLNAVIILSNDVWMILGAFALLTVAYIFSRLSLEGSKRLFNQYEAG